MKIDKTKIENESAFDINKKVVDESIGFFPDIVLKNREELKINLIYYNRNITKSDESYIYYKKFKVNVVGGFYACDEKNIFKRYLEEMQKLNNCPPFVVVTVPRYCEEVYDISKNYNFIKQIILISLQKSKYEYYLDSHKKLCKFIAKDYKELIDYLKQIGQKEKKWYEFSKKNSIFTPDDIQMNRHLSVCPIITSYEYDHLYFLVHRAYSFFFTNESKTKNPKNEKYPIFDQDCFDKIKSYLLDAEIDNNTRAFLLSEFKELRDCDDFLVNSIKKYTVESPFCYFLSRIMRHFDVGLINIAYFMGPFLFSLYKYALDHPEKCLNQDTILHRKILLNPLDKYNYKLAVGHIICFPALTSTTIVSDSFSPTILSENINAGNIETNIGEKINIEMIIKYKHQTGNITPGLNIEDLSENPGEKERLLFPFTFFRLNKIEKNNNSENSYIFYMDIINRKKFIEYDLIEGKRYNIEDLEEFEEINHILIEEGNKIDFINKEKKGDCTIF